MVVELHPDAVNALVYADHGAPFEILGAHTAGEEGVVIRALRPWLRTLTLIIEPNGRRVEMTKIRPEGLFEAVVEGKVDTIRYHFEGVTFDDETEKVYDPYSFSPILTDFDLHLFGEGRHLNIYEKLGAHLREINHIKGVHFAVWAPNARRMSIVGDFNRWDTRAHPMRQLDNSGVWELFIPGLGPGTIYKYDVRSHHMGYAAQKTDPYGFHAEVRPKTASIVTDLSTYTWKDSKWLAARAEKSMLKSPMSIYEVHLGSWKRALDGLEGGRWLTYRELAHDLVDYVKHMGFTHIELLPITEHPFDGSWGYQTTGYFSPTSRFGSPQDFMYFVDYCHQNGIGVLLDWVPAHFPKDGHALSYFDGTHLYEHEDARRGEHPDWGTYIFNFGRNEVRNFLLASAMFWLSVYHIDGLRVDAVSSMIYLNFSRKEGEWIPNQYGGNENLEALSFMREMNEIVHREAPGAITVAEESTSWAMVSRPTYLGGLGFTFKWDMGWMHDTLKYMALDPIYRRYHHNEISFSMMYAYSENFIQALSHDEVVHGKGSLINKIAGDWWQKFATLRLLFGYQYTHPGKKLNFMGQEFGQWSEWSEARSLDWHLLDLPMHKGVQAWMRDLNQLYQKQPALYEVDTDWRGFRWIDANNADQSIFTYLRFAEDQSDFLVVGINFTPMPRYDHLVGVPQPGYYTELLNSDASVYGGGNVGNAGGLSTVDMAWQGFSHVLKLTLPPLAIVILKLSSQF